MAANQIQHPYSQAGQYQVNPDNTDIWNTDYRKLGDIGGDTGGGILSNVGNSVKNWWNQGIGVHDNWSNENNPGKTYNNQGDLVDAGTTSINENINDTNKGLIQATGAFDSANFNVEDKNQVMNLQKQLFPDDANEWDGVFGPKTEEAYRGMVNEQRVGAGQDPYTYDSPEQGGFGSGQGWLSRIGKGGEGFLGKFGTGEGWLSRGAERRAARKQPSDNITEVPGNQGDEDGFNLAGFGKSLMDMGANMGNNSYKHQMFG